jgi:membrane-associated PAP2 superfamily phosphatase
MKWWLPIICMAILAPFSSWLDLKISHAFYTWENANSFVNNTFTDFIYNYAFWPGLGLASCATAVWILSWAVPSWKQWRSHALFLLIPAILGAWVIVHLVLKDHWGRPRPKQIIAFGGAQPFRPFYVPNLLAQPEPSKSFPCGHCTMGFYFFVAGLLGRRLKVRWLFWGGISLAVVLGSLLGITRIAQGGHFLSDVLISALILWLTTLLCEVWIYERADPTST